ncbi:E3 ubiquitin-protein ligase ZFP91 [Megalops cyprinoides]|uniref:E3 ubiquitin-protein ligase ZFP91 n=1 Tax=Megalops cyprinoides TaxID=118141 RepID=UPI001863F498|nr:E3 ubiquitin-protein ligase ZFP91 [Megalops cyprinoides]
MDPEISRAAGSSAEASGEVELPGEKAAAPSPTPRPAPARGRVLRERGLGRSQTGVSSAGPNDSRSSTPGSGRVLRDRSSKGVVAGRNAGAGGNTKGQNEVAAANRRRKSEYPRRRRNTGARGENSGETGDDSGLAIDSEDKKDPSDKASRSSRSRRPQPPPRQRAPSARTSRPSPTLVCKSEPDTETAYGAAEDVLERTGGSDDEDDVLIGEEDPPFRDDPNDLNYKPEAERDPQKPRRRPPRQKEDKKEKERDKERGKEIKTEGGEEMDVKLENEFGEETEPPRKRGRRRKDDKSPRLPKRRKKPPVQYVRCEMEGCGTVLAHPRYLQHHIKYQHLLKKKYVCPHPSCGRLFRLQKQLLRHAKHHTDQRDYICEYCARAFKSSHNLAVHRMIHTGEKPLQCEICGFTCRQKASLNWHMKKHDADAFYQFSCNICGKKFEKKDSVVAHKAKSHPEVLIAEALAANAGALITTPTPLLEALPGTGQGEHMVVVSEEQNLPPMQVPLPLALPLTGQQIITTHPQQTQLLQLTPHTVPATPQQQPQLLQLTPHTTHAPAPQPPAPLLPQTQDLVNSRESLGLGPISTLSSSPPPPSSSLHQPVMSTGEGGGVWEGDVEGERHRPEGGVVWEREVEGDRDRDGAVVWEREGDGERDRGDGGIVWEREGDREILLESAEAQVQHGNHHGLM